MNTPPADPRGLIAQAYEILDISPADCRSIFFDWLLGLPATTDPRTALADLLRLHEAHHPAHPMTTLLQSGLPAANPAARQRKRHADPRKPRA